MFLDSTKADGKNLTLVVADVVKRLDSNRPLYCLAYNAGVLDTLYHPSYMVAIQSTPAVLGMSSVLDEWTGLPKIKERKAATSVSIVGGQGKHLGCGCRRGTCHTGRCACFKAGLKCCAQCYGASSTTVRTKSSLMMIIVVTEKHSIIICHCRPNFGSTPNDSAQMGITHSPLEQYLNYIQ